MATDDVSAFWQRLGLPGLIDAHVHFMPDPVLAKVWRYFDEAGPLVGRPWPIQYRLPEDERLALLRSWGVRAFPSLLYPHKPGMAAWLNEWAGEFADRVPECLRTATFFPEPSAGSYVSAALDAGVRVFKAHVQVGAYDPRDPLLRPVWGALADAGVPVVVHVGDGPVAGRFTGPGPFGEVLAAFPSLVAVVAHLGLPDAVPFLDLADRYDGVHLDTTMAFTAFWGGPGAADPDVVRRLSGLRSRLLLGTDFPNIPHPYVHQLDVLAELGLGDDWLRAVCWDNAARLFGVGVTPGGVGT